MHRKILTIFFLLFLTKNCPDDSFCLECLKNKDNKTYSCLTCQYSTLNTEKDFCQPLKKEIPNCVVYNNKVEDQCLNCERGYGIDSNYGNCIKCENYCANCNEKGCLACFDGNLIDNGNCENSKFQCGEKNCEICDKENICLKCKNGFSLQDFNCKKGVDFCLEGTEDICTKCEFGYYVDSKFECKIYKKMIPQDFFTKMLIYVSSVFFIILFSYLIYSCGNKQAESKIEKLIQ